MTNKTIMDDVADVAAVVGATASHAVAATDDVAATADNAALLCNAYRALLA